MISDKLVAKINEKQSPIVVGLDPLLDRIPTFIMEEAIRQHGNSQKAAISAIEIFNQQILEEIHPLAPAVKLQKACYEIFGGPGIELFERTARQAKELGLVVIDDSKRGDIGSTALLYAKGLLGGAPLEESTPASDYVTVNPYMGWDGIDPFVEICNQQDKGLFILVRTSNPSASQYQEAVIDGMPLYEKVAMDLESASSKKVGKSGFSHFGAVVGATWPKEAIQLRKLMPTVYFLVPGYGAQGGTAEEVTASFDHKGYGALINSSRGIIFAYQDQSLPAHLQKPENFHLAAKWATEKMREELLAALQQQGKLPKQW